ncbi:MAG: tryptophan synthase subunit alpha [Pseudomonadota bacterium]
MSRINGVFEKLRAEGRAAFIPFIMAGDPDGETSLEVLNALPAAGADIIELGVAFSDPMADGPSIQAAGRRALKAGQTLAKTLAMAKSFRKGNNETPLVLMGYLNPIEQYGLERFAADAAAAGVDGLIVVDAPPEEDAALRAAANGTGLDVIRLATPTSDENRLSTIIEGASGFLYYVSVAGVTGAGSAASDAVAAAVARVKTRTGIPVGVGFGIKTPEQAAETARCADAVVVGSALVDRLASGSPEKRADGLEAAGDATDISRKATISRKERVAAVIEYAQTLAAAVRGARDGV